MRECPPAAASPSPASARLCILLAALLWSTSGALTKLLCETTPLHLNEPRVTPEQIAFFRVFFAAVVLAPLLRRRDLSFRPAMLLTALCFAAMNVLFVSAMAEGTAANAILLQYTAPMWMYLASVWLLGEPADRRGAVALALGLAGVAVIVWGGWGNAQLPVIAVALGSGVTYAGVMIGLRVLRRASSTWLTTFNHLVGALVLVPFLGRGLPSAPQFLVLFVFGAVQAALAYWLVARGLRRVSPQEAGTLTLIEPVLNPLWAFLVSPATERPSVYTLTGGGCILAALAYSYWPFRKAVPVRGRA